MAIRTIRPSCCTGLGEDAAVLVVVVISVLPGFSAKASRTSATWLADVDPRQVGFVDPDQQQSRRSAYAALRLQPG
jgi:hypothetical protein